MSVRATAATAATRKAVSRSVSVGGVVGYMRPPRKFHGQRGFHEAAFSRQTAEDMANIIARFQELADKVKRATPEALVSALEPTFYLSQVYVPVDTGSLSESGALEIDGTSSRPRAYIQYGGSTSGVNYAAIVHERLELHHEPPTRSKYLEAAFNETLRGFKSRIIAALKPVVEGA